MAEVFQAAAVSYFNTLLESWRGELGLLLTGQSENFYREVDLAKYLEEYEVRVLAGMMALALPHAKVQVHLNFRAASTARFTLTVENDYNPAYDPSFGEQ